MVIGLQLHEPNDVVVTTNNDDGKLRVWRVDGDGMFVEYEGWPKDAR